MKKILACLIASVVLFSCSEESPVVPDPNNAPAVSSVPDHFVQKIVIESFTMASCGQCPKANLFLDSLIRFNTDRIYGVQFHIDDAMADTSLVQPFSGRNYYDSLFNPAGIYPAGMLNRNLNSLSDLAPELWGSRAFSMLTRVPSCGVALEAENLVGNILKLVVHVGFSADMYGQYRIHAYVVKNVVQTSDSTYDQMNDFSIDGATPDSTLPLYQLNDTINRYAHKYVLQKVVTPDGVEGTIIPESAMIKGNHYATTLDLNISGVNADNSFILVFIDKHATSLTNHWIENVQVVKIGESKDWN
jgi:hypothetical protein